MSSFTHVPESYIKYKFQTSTDCLHDSQTFRWVMGLCLLGLLIGSSGSWMVHLFKWWVASWMVGNCEVKPEVFPK